MFVDEDQWRRAFEAAMNQVEHLYATGVIEIPHGKINGTLRDVAVQIAAAALRAAARDDEGDIRDLTGVHIDEIRNHTRKGLRPDLILIDDISPEEEEKP